MKRISLLFILILLSCNKQESKGHLRNNKEINSLKNAPYNITDEGDGTKSNYDDLSPEFIKTAKKILAQRKFQFPDENTFNHKVSEVFSINLKEYSNPIIALRPSVFPEVAIREDQFIFIQDASANEPEFINPDLLYRFNSYVFYNTPVSYIWLQSNSPNLLYDLVVHYGYNKDKKLVESIFKKYDFNSLSEMEELIFRDSGTHKKLKKQIFDDIETIIYKGKVEDFSYAKEGNGYLRLGEIINTISASPKEYDQPEQTISYLFERELRVEIQSDIESYLNKNSQYQIDYSIDSKYIYLDGKNSCNKSIAYNRNTDDEMEPTSYYLIKNNRFITELFAIPEIIDYSTAFPETKSFEDKVNNIQNDVHITKWNEDKNLSQKRFENINKLVARNKYLFNNSKADLAWLLANDKEFLRKLVVTFGYDKEQKINKQVIDDLYKSYTQSGQIWYGAKLGEVFFTKDCQGKLQTQEGLLNYVSQNTNENDDRFIYALSNYIVYLFKEDKDAIFSEAPSKKFTLEEKAKIVAYVANIESPAFYKYKPLNSNSAWRNAGTSLYNITAAHPEILKIIEKNNYYGLTALKEVINSTQFEEEAPITNQSGE